MDEHLMRLLFFALAIATVFSIPVPASAENSGRLLYRYGVGAMGRGESLPCRNCHGDDARGQDKEGINAPAILWSELTSQQRENLAYDEERLRKALVGGATPDGRILSSKMPRYQLSSAKVSELVHYLREISQEEGRGVTSKWVDIGIAKQENSPAFDRFVNSFEAALRGKAVYGRKLRIVAFDKFQLRSPKDAEQAISSLPVLAWIGDMEEDSQSPVLQTLTRLGVPRLFPRRALLGTEDSRDVRGAFVTLLDQSRILVDAAAAEGPGEILIVASTGQEKLLQSAEIQCRLYVQINCLARLIDPHSQVSDLENGFSRVIAFSSDNSWNRSVLEKFRSHNLFVLGDQFAMAMTAEDVSTLSMRVLDPRPHRSAENSNDSERLGNVAAHLLLRSIEQAGRKLTRTSLMRSLSTVQLEISNWPALDYARYSLVGTNEVSMIVFENGSQRSQNNLRPRSLQ